MPDIVLSDREQDLVRSLVALEPVPGAPLSTPAVVQLIGRLVGCDGVRVAAADPPGTDTAEDLLALDLRTSRGHGVRLVLVRDRGRFSERDRALLRMVAPALRRLLSGPPVPLLPATLTLSERRVLQLLATGLTNADIAAYLHVAPSTVRKHLEHAFPKLGVTNRLAAARVFESALAPVPGAATGPEAAETFA
ncbi:helix-turn-helix transcriptional regulator [Nocardioides sediminis]|uniref:helix-turn-helix transcriptional regulator n=1 Tax=Nocardioides sediminis TaxID=433648 RepID=UPI001F1FB461|nr:helix-turn-helix transcriptional regulator [Nocardioides sediminis]